MTSAGRRLAAAAVVLLAVLAVPVGPAGAQSRSGAAEAQAAAGRWLPGDGGTVDHRVDAPDRALAAQAPAAEPVEGWWLVEGGTTVIHIRAIGFGQFSGTTVQIDPRSRCRRQFVARPWILTGSGQQGTGLVAWIRLRGCRELGYGEVRWELSEDAQRLRTCSSPPFTGPPSPTDDERTRCRNFTRTGIGASIGGRRVCFSSQVVGVRGSGEPLDGPFGMGETVGRTAGALRAALDRQGVGTYSLPYPAAPVSDLARDLGRPFFDSIDRGVAMLVAYVGDLTARCRQIRLALVGYSQGAAVVSEAVRRLAAPARRRVRAVVLIADPYSAGRSAYALTPSRFPGGTPRRNGTGGLGARPAALPARTTDVCFATDLVCDAPQGLASSSVLYDAFTVSVHTQYKTCCSWWRGYARLPAVLGSDAARLMR